MSAYAPFRRLRRITTFGLTALRLASRRLFKFAKGKFEKRRMVEMPGVEPGSGKPRYQISTRLVNYLISPEKLQLTGFSQASLRSFAFDTQARAGRYPTLVRP